MTYENNKKMSLLYYQKRPAYSGKFCIFIYIYYKNIRYFSLHFYYKIRNT